MPLVADHSVHNPSKLDVEAEVVHLVKYST